MGLVLYISSINDEMLNRTRDAETYFSYKYGWSFAFAAISFLLTEVKPFEGLGGGGAAARGEEEETRRAPPFTPPPPLLSPPDPPPHPLLPHPLPYGRCPGPQHQRLPSASSRRARG